MPFRAALDHTPRGKSLDTAEETLHCIHLICSNGNDQLTDLRHLGKREQRPQEHRLAGKRQKDLVQPRIHPMCLPCRRKNHTYHVPILHLRKH